MSNSYFRFKQFTVQQAHCAMKVGIDGVLLGVWANVANTQTILDIGTGTGLIALMLAQRSAAQITAIDIDEGAVKQATENIAHSPWKDRIQVEQCTLQLFTPQTTVQFDHIVSNPPYFVDSLKAGNVQRSTARHADTLTHEELLQNAKMLLKETGRMSIILPVNEGLQCIETAKSIGFHCSKLLTVYPTPTSDAKRLLIEFMRQTCVTETSELTIETNIRHHYSAEFSALAKDFYLKL